MRTKEEIRKSIAAVLSELREKKGLSQVKMADLAGVDRHTWRRWESGANSPTVEDLVTVFDRMGESLAWPLLEILYPDNDFDPDHIQYFRREAAEHYLEKASDHHLKVWHYMKNEIPEQEFNAQVEEFCALDHLPMHYRYFIAEHIYVYYMMARNQSELIRTNEVMPDVGLFSRGLIRTQKAAFDRLKED